MQGFQNCVREAWERVVPKNQNALSVLHTKLGRIAKAIKKWSKPFVPQGKIGIVVCREVVAQLEKAQESRVLSQGEKKMIKELKLRILGLSAIEKCRARQKSRVTWFRRGDANTIFFIWWPAIEGRKISYTPCNLTVGLHSLKLRNTW
jgi:hypothetical protein